MRAQRPVGDHQRRAAGPLQIGSIACWHQPLALAVGRGSWWRSSRISNSGCGRIARARLMALALAATQACSLPAPATSVSEALRQLRR